MKNSILIVVLLSFMVSCSEETIVGSGNIVSEEREVISFSRINNEGVIDMEITQGDSQFIEITADDNVIFLDTLDKPYSRRIFTLKRGQLRRYG